ncbi:hypothetical protein F443_10097 [Phytophthora nicotianae P1569]|uniref:Uncharacterized protein n=1 Tax=Phytophthora nicotianae P1569 TaxID=1317065 RepID=V9F2E8_PHYNI|nr:hypothetical protein F443_10097 [Phytophthora nicotianae P1569]
MVRGRAYQWMIRLMEALAEMHLSGVVSDRSDLEESIDLQTLDPAENEARKKQLKKKNFCGTPAYMAPEVVARERDQAQVSSVIVRGYKTLKHKKHHKIY